MSTTPVHAILQRHPCFNEQAHDWVGRIHLPVAPRCNLQCAFCEHRICATLTMQHPGWAHALCTPAEAVARVRNLADKLAGQPFVVGIAGPGDPLANEESFETLEAIHHAFPALLLCLSTNGLLLEETLPRLLAVGISALTVTVNTPDAAVGEQIYAWVEQQGTRYYGREAAERLIAAQMRGIQAALTAGLALKVNTVLIPGVNDLHVVRLAERLREAGVHLMNLMPLIPSGAMRDRRAPTCEELRQARAACEAVLPQFRRCEHCRADVVRLPRHRRSEQSMRHTPHLNR